MRRNRSVFVIPLLLLLVACGPSRPPTESARALPTASPTPFSVLRGLVYDLMGGAASPIEDSQIEYQVRRENRTAQQGELVSDAQGRFVLSLSLQKGDVLTVRAAAPGFSPGELYLTTEQVAAGAPLEIGLRAPTQSVLNVDGLQWQPADQDASIQKPGALDSGGVVRLYFTNVGALPVSVERLALDGMDIAKQISARRAEWSRLWPDLLAPGEMGVWEIKLTQSPKEASFSLYPSGASPVHTQAELSPSWLSIRYLTFSEDRELLLLYVRNEHSKALARLEAVSLNGTDVQAEIKQRDLGPGEVGLIMLMPDVYPAPGELVCVQVRGRATGGERITAWASARLFEPFFPIGVWPDARELNKATQDDLRLHGLDTLILDLPARRDDPTWVQLSQNGFRLIGAPRVALNKTQLVAFADGPALAGWLLADQPETTNKSAAELVAASQLYRQSSKLPLFVNLSAYSSLARYAPIADIVGISHFAIDGPTDNSTGSHALEKVLTYTPAARDAAAPNPIWAWAQGMCSSDWQKDVTACWNRLPIVAEMRAQLYLQLIAGAKGVFWANHRAAYVTAAPQQWKEIGRMNRMLQALSSLLLYGEPAETVTARKGRVKATAIVSPQAVAVPLVNLDYTWEQRTWVAGQAAPPSSPAYVFRPQEKLGVSVLLPEWVEPNAVFLVTPSETRDLKWSADGRLVTFTLDRLEDVAMVVIGSSDLRKKLDARLKQ